MFAFLLSGVGVGWQNWSEMFWEEGRGRLGEKEKVCVERGWGVGEGVGTYWREGEKGRERQRGKRERERQTERERYVIQPGNAYMNINSLYI